MELTRCLRLAVVALLLVGCSEQPIQLTCNPEIPEQYASDSPQWQPPNGETEAVRYRKAYEAFWWHCVSVKAADPLAQCPMVCSGTPAAAAGCTDGTRDLEAQLSTLLESQSEATVIEYLRALAATEEAHEKTAPYYKHVIGA